jgi:hypothetical protein
MNETNISWRMIPTFDFTPEMFSVQVIEVMGTPSDTDDYIRNFVSQNCIKISRNVEKIEPFTVGFAHFQLVQKCRTHVPSTDMSVNITLPPQGQFLSVQDHHVDTVIANVILKKSTRGSLHFWTKDDYDLVVTVFHKSHTFGGFGLTPNVITQISVKVGMSTRFLGLVGSLSLEEQKLWVPNQLVHDPDSWTTPYLLHKKKGNMRTV